MARCHTAPGQATVPKQKPLPPCLVARPQSLPPKMGPQEGRGAGVPSNQLKTRSEFKYKKNKHLSFLTSSSDPTSLDPQRPSVDAETQEQENGGRAQEQRQPPHPQSHGPRGSKPRAWASA